MVDADALAYRFAPYPAALLHQFAPQAQQLLAHLQRSGSTAGYPGLIDLARIKAVLGADQLLATAERYAG